MAKKSFGDFVSDINGQYTDKPERLTTLTEAFSEQEKSPQGNESHISINTDKHNLETIEKLPTVNRKKIYVENKVQENERVVRDGFSIPQSEYELLGKLRLKALSNMEDINKSELLRAGLQCLSKLSDKEFLRAIQAVSRIKPGRKS